MGTAFSSNRGDQRGHGVDAVRRLTEADGGEFWRLRREALQREPASFGESVEEHLKLSPATIAERLGSNSENFVYGAFDRGALVATAGFYREQRIKRRHKGTVWGVYVAPDYRGLGLGRAVMTALLESIRALPDLKCVNLSITSTQSPARSLYVSLGFRPFGVEPRALVVDGHYFDEEHMVLEL
ncbi:MAG TPA: GNAT family N-acetyltransferase [Bryobacteraceae bacterium]|nr:GNAT family N-acetyltransferase [Bryobacteraceae bacterium]